MCIGRGIMNCAVIYPFVLEGAYLLGIGDVSVPTPVNQQKYALTMEQDREQITTHLVSWGVDDHLETCSQVVGELTETQLDGLAVDLVKAFLSTTVEGKEPPAWYTAALDTADRASLKASAAQVAGRKRRADSQLVPRNPLAQAMASFNQSVQAQQRVAAVIVNNAVARANAAEPQIGAVPQNAAEE